MIFPASLNNFYHIEAIWFFFSLEVKTVRAFRRVRLRKEKMFSGRKYQYLLLEFKNLLLIAILCECFIKKNCGKLPNQRNTDTARNGR